MCSDNIIVIGDIRMIFEKINDCYCFMTRESRVLLRAGLYITDLVYLCAAAAAVFYGRFFPDVDTACCFLGEILACAKELSGAFFVPVLIYETVRAAVKSRESVQ